MYFSTCWSWLWPNVSLAIIFVLGHNRFLKVMGRHEKIYLKDGLLFSSQTIMKSSTKLAPTNIKNLLASTWMRLNLFYLLIMIFRAVRWEDIGIVGTYEERFLLLSNRRASFLSVVLFSVLRSPTRSPLARPGSKRGGGLGFLSKLCSLLEIFISCAARQAPWGPAPPRFAKKGPGRALLCARLGFFLLGALRQLGWGSWVEKRAGRTNLRAAVPEERQESTAQTWEAEDSPQT